MILRTLLVVVGGLFVSLGTAAPAAAQEGGATLSFCYIPTTGTVYRIGAPGLPQACFAESHVPFTMNQEGPAGPAGPEGPQGPAGTSGVSSRRVEVLTTVVPITTAPDFTTLTVSCDAGEIAISGGFQGLGFNMTVLGSFPSATDPAQWVFHIRDHAGVDPAITLTATCVAGT